MLLQKYLRVEFFIESMLQIVKANDFDRDGCRSFLVPVPCWKMNAFLFAPIISGLNCICFPAQEILGRSLKLCIDNHSYRLQSMYRQYFLPTSISRWTIFALQLLCSPLTFSLLQIQHKPSFLLDLIPTQTILPTCFSSKILLK